MIIISFIEKMSRSPHLYNINKGDLLPEAWDYAQHRIGRDQERNERIHKKTTKQLDATIINPQALMIPNTTNGDPPPISDIVDFKLNLISSYNDIKLKSYICSVQNQIAVVFMFHGLNSWTGHGYHLMVSLKAAGITTVAFDYATFGRSDPQPTSKDTQTGRGIIKSRDQFISDCTQFRDKAWDQLKSRGVNKNIKKFAMGLSLGGTAAYTLTHQDFTIGSNFFSGAILMAPAIKLQVAHDLLYPNGNISQRLIQGQIKKIDRPQNAQEEVATILKPNRKSSKRQNLSEQFKTPRAFISFAVGKQMENDKYVPKNTLRCGTASFLVSQSDKNARQNPTISHFKDYTMPFYIIQGGNDGYVNPMNSFALHQASSSNNKKIYFDKEMYHDIWHDKNIIAIMFKVIGWINDVVRTKATKSAPKKTTKLVSKKAPAPKVKANKTQKKPKVTQVTKAAPKKKKISKRSRK